MCEGQRPTCWRGFSPSTIKSQGLNSELGSSGLTASTFVSDQSCWTTGVDFMGKNNGMGSVFPKSGGGDPALNVGTSSQEN